MIVDTSPKKRITEGGNHVELGRQLYGTPFTVTMSPTTKHFGARIKLTIAVRNLQPYHM